MDKREVIAKMTLEQKAALLTGKDFWQSMNYDELGVPSIVLSDGPHGIRRQAAAADHLGLNASIPATCFPTAAAMANSWNEELGERMGEALGEEAASEGVSVLLGPGTNMKRNPRCGRNFEYFSEDPYLAGKMAAAYIRGIQANGTAACVKHFACNNQELRRMANDSVLDERTLREIYLTAFEIAVKEGKTKTIMSSYNLINGEYANENKHLLRDILRGEWGFEGVVVSDWAGSNSRTAAVEAGSDLEMPACKYGAEDIVLAVEKGELDIKYVDECVERILTLVEAAEKVEKGKEFDTEAHHAIAEQCAEESVVLLQNNGILPLKQDTKIAVIGDFVTKPRYQGAGSSVVNPTKLDTVESCIKEYGLTVTGIEKGFDRYGKKKKGLIKKAVKLVKQSDVALMFLGLDEVSEAEGLDREHIRIPQNQIDLYNRVKATGKKVVVVLSLGSSVETEWLKHADGLVYACLTGQAGARAVLNILTGKTNPSGKLAETFPVAYDDCASASHFPGLQLTVEYREGPYIGYRYFDTTNTPVRFPFGFGLSYTTYEYSDLKVTKEGATLTVTNTGEMDGAEIIQLYVGKPDGKVFRPAKELKAFKKVFLKAGESATVSLAFDDKTFRYFNVKTNAWEEEEGEYAIYVGASSADIRLTGTLTREGTGAESPYTPEEFPSYFTGDVKKVGNREFEKLLGHEIPRAGYTFYKKNRMVIHENCTVADLRYSRRWVGRAFAGAIRFAISFMRGIGNRTMANTLVMGVLHQPVRGIAKFGGMSRRQMEGLLLMFNGHFFKGLGQLLFKGKKKEAKKADKTDKSEEKPVE